VALAREREAIPLRYVARQPIVDRDQKVFGYELLFRDGIENCFSGDPGGGGAFHARPFAGDGIGRPL